MEKPKTPITQKWGQGVKSQTQKPGASHLPAHKSPDPKSGPPAPAPFTNTWLFSEDSFLSKSPSRKQMSLLQDLKVRELIHAFLIKLGSHLKLDGRTILAATVLINRFYMRVPITTSKYFVVCAALAISCKLHDLYRLPDKIALAGCMIKNPSEHVDQHSSLFWQWRDQLLYREELILRMLNFDLDVILPYDIVESLESKKDESSSNGFEVKLGDVLKQAVAKIELLSAWPILVSFDMNTFFATSLVLTVREARQKFNEFEEFFIPKKFIEESLGVSLQNCYYCLKYILKLKSCCEDPKLPSHPNVVSKITVISKDEFFEIALGRKKEISKETSPSELNKEKEAIAELLDI